MKGVPDCKSSFILELGDCINNAMFAAQKSSMQALLGMCKGMSLGSRPPPTPGGCCESISCLSFEGDEDGEHDGGPRRSIHSPGPAGNCMGQMKTYFGDNGIFDKGGVRAHRAAQACLSALLRAPRRVLS